MVFDFIRVPPPAARTITVMRLVVITLPGRRTWPSEHSDGHGATGGSARWDNDGVAVPIDHGDAAGQRSVDPGHRAVGDLAVGQLDDGQDEQEMDEPAGDVRDQPEQPHRPGNAETAHPDRESRCDHSLHDGERSEQ